MNISLTGGGGFIGKRLIELLDNRDISLRILVRKDIEIKSKSNFQYIKGDLLFKETLAPLFENCNIFIHCAAEIVNKNLMHRINVQSTKNLLELAKIQFYKSGVKAHWIQLSSVGAYGLGNIGGEKLFRNITEDSPHAPENIYERTKTEADELIQEAGLSGYITYTLLRPSAVFGRGMPNNSLRQLIKAIKSNLFFYIGDGKGIFNYIYVDDVCNAIIECLYNDNAKNEVFNLSNDCQQEELINSIALLCNVSQPKIHISANMLMPAIRILEPFFSLPLTSSRVRAMTSKNKYNTSKIETLLNFKPQHSISEKIIELL